MSGKVKKNDGRKAQASSTRFHEHNVGNVALQIIATFGSGERIDLFLEDWEIAKVGLSCHIALDMLCQERLDM